MNLDHLHELRTRVCPVHGSFASVDIKEDGLYVDACCSEFDEQLRIYHDMASAQTDQGEDS